VGEQRVQLLARLRLRNRPQRLAVQPQQLHLPRAATLNGSNPSAHDAARSPSGAAPTVLRGVGGKWFQGRTIKSDTLSSRSEVNR
jgi:hypothetical protein